jgi:hypothetical protein
LVTVEEQSVVSPTPRFVESQLFVSVTSAGVLLKATGRCASLTPAPCPPTSRRISPKYCPSASWAPPIVMVSCWLSPASRVNWDGTTVMRPGSGFVTSTVQLSVVPLTLVAVRVVVTRPGITGTLMLGRFRLIRPSGSSAAAK